MYNKKFNYSLVLFAFFPFLLIFSAIAQDGKVFCASYTATPPEIDADLSDPCWSHTERIDDFTMITSPKSRPLNKTTFQVVYSDTHLYFAVECWLSDTSEIESPIPEPGIVDQYTSKYSIEIFIDPQGTCQNYYQLAWSVNGMRYDGLKMYKDKFNGAWIVKTKILKNRWISELAIPLSALMNSKPLPGTKWGFNICRNDISNYGIWKNTDGSFHNPEMYGDMIIGDYQTWWNKSRSIIKGFKNINCQSLPESTYIKKIYNRGFKKAVFLESKENIKIETRDEFLERYQELETLSFDLKAIREYISCPCKCTSAP